MDGKVLRFLDTVAQAIHAKCGAKSLAWSATSLHQELLNTARALSARKLLNALNENAEHYSLLLRSRLEDLSYATARDAHHSPAADASLIAPSLTRKDVTKKSASARFNLASTAELITDVGYSTAVVSTIQAYEAGDFDTSNAEAWKMVIEKLLHSRCPAPVLLCGAYVSVLNLMHLKVKRSSNGINGSESGNYGLMSNKPDGKSTPQDFRNILDGVSECRNLLRAFKILPGAFHFTREVSASLYSIISMAFPLLEKIAIALSNSESKKETQRTSWKSKTMKKAVMAFHKFCIELFTFISGSAEDSSRNLAFLPPKPSAALLSHSKSFDSLLKTWRNDISQKSDERHSGLPKQPALNQYHSVMISSDSFADQNAADAVVLRFMGEFFYLRFIRNSLNTSKDSQSDTQIMLALKLLFIQSISSLQGDFPGAYAYLLDDSSWKVLGLLDEKYESKIKNLIYACFFFECPVQFSNRKNELVFFIASIFSARKMFSSLRASGKISASTRVLMDAQKKYFPLNFLLVLKEMIKSKDVFSSDFLSNSIFKYPNKCIDWLVSQASDEVFFAIYQGFFNSVNVQFLQPLSDEFSKINDIDNKEDNDKGVVNTEQLFVIDKERNELNDEEMNVLMESIDDATEGFMHAAIAMRGKGEKKKKKKEMAKKLLKAKMLVKEIEYVGNEGGVPRDSKTMRDDVDIQTGAADANNADRMNHGGILDSDHDNDVMQAKMKTEKGKSISVEIEKQAQIEASMEEEEKEVEESEEDEDETEIKLEISKGTHNEVIESKGNKEKEKVESEEDEEEKEDENDEDEMEKKSDAEVKVENATETKKEMNGFLIESKKNSKDEEENDEMEEDENEESSEAKMEKKMEAERKGTNAEKVIKEMDNEVPEGKEDKEEDVEGESEESDEDEEKKIEEAVIVAENVKENIKNMDEIIEGKRHKDVIEKEADEECDEESDEEETEDDGDDEGEDEREKSKGAIGLKLENENQMKNEVDTELNRGKNENNSNEEEGEEEAETKKEEMKVKAEDEKEIIEVMDDEIIGVKKDEREYGNESEDAEEKKEEANLKLENAIEKKKRMGIEMNEGKEDNDDEEDGGESEADEDEEMDIEMNEGKEDDENEEDERGSEVDEDEKGKEKKRQGIQLRVESAIEMGCEVIEGKKVEAEGEDEENEDAEDEDKEEAEDEDESQGMDTVINERKGGHNKSEEDGDEKRKQRVQLRVNNKKETSGKDEEDENEDSEQKNWDDEHENEGKNENEKNKGVDLVIESEKETIKEMDKFNEGKQDNEDKINEEDEEEEKKEKDGIRVDVNEMKKDMGSETIEGDAVEKAEETEEETEDGDDEHKESKGNENGKTEMKVEYVNDNAKDKEEKEKSKAEKYGDDEEEANEERKSESSISKGVMKIDMEKDEDEKRGNDKSAESKRKKDEKTGKEETEAENKESQEGNEVGEDNGAGKEINPILIHLRESTTKLMEFEDEDNNGIEERKKVNKEAIEIKEKGGQEEKMPEMEEGEEKRNEDRNNDGDKNNYKRKTEKLNVNSKREGENDGITGSELIETEHDASIIEESKGMMQKADEIITVDNGAEEKPNDGAIAKNDEREGEGKDNGNVGEERNKCEDNRLQLTELKCDLEMSESEEVSQNHDNEKGEDEEEELKRIDEPDSSKAGNLEVFENQKEVDIKKGKVKEKEAMDGKGREVQEEKEVGREEKVEGECEAKEVIEGITTNYTNENEEEAIRKSANQVSDDAIDPEMDKFFTPETKLRIPKLLSSDTKSMTPLSSEKKVNTKGKSITKVTKSEVKSVLKRSQKGAVSDERKNLFLNENTTFCRVVDVSSRVVDDEGKTLDLQEEKKEGANLMKGIETNSWKKRKSSFTGMGIDTKGDDGVGAKESKIQGACIETPDQKMEASGKSASADFEVNTPALTKGLALDDEFRYSSRKKSRSIEEKDKVKTSEKVSTPLIPEISFAAETPAKADTKISSLTESTVLDAMEAVSEREIVAVIDKGEITTSIAVSDSNADNPETAKKSARKVTSSRKKQVIEDVLRFISPMRTRRGPLGSASKNLPPITKRQSARKQKDTPMSKSTAVQRIDETNNEGAPAQLNLTSATLESSLKRKTEGINVASVGERVSTERDVADKDADVKNDDDKIKDRAVNSTVKTTAKRRVATRGKKKNAEDSDSDVDYSVPKTSTIRKIRKINKFADDDNDAGDPSTAKASTVDVSANIKAGDSIVQRIVSRFEDNISPLHTRSGKALNKFTTPVSVSKKRKT